MNICDPSIKYYDDSDPTWRAITARATVVFLDGASATGKTTFKNMLLADSAFAFSYIRRYTTRAQRPDDIEGRDYIFVPHHIFVTLREHGQLIEYRDFLFGMSYGIGRAEVVRAYSKSHQLLGVMNLGNVPVVKKQIPQSICVLVDAPLEAIERRLRGRGANTEGQIAERLCNAAKAKKLSDEYDFVCLNDDGQLKAAYGNLKAFLSDQLMTGSKRC